MATAEFEQVSTQSGDNPWRLACTVNGQERAIDIDPHLTFLEILREDMGLTGTKGACYEGECGSCTVLVDGVPMNACLIMAPQMEGRDIVTIEGLAAGTRAGATEPALDPVQEAFVVEGAVQCGFCTPGLIMSAKALLATHSALTYEQVREGLEGNICRCTGYMKVLGAVLAAARGRE